MKTHWDLNEIMEENVVGGVAEKDGKLFIFIKADHAGRYHDFLRGKKIDCTPPDAILSKLFVVESDGRKQFAEIPSVCVIIADGTVSDWNAWTNEWLDKP
ncbi:MAG TPA: hypothetical protein VMH30_12270 [Verrucomicrobiae bacterium]|nr:hypothetical protein [Verrucomicrobiae bacterium]